MPQEQECDICGKPKPFESSIAIFDFNGKPIEPHLYVCKDCRMNTTIVKLYEILGNKNLYRLQKVFEKL